jgi:PilZ domain
LRASAPLFTIILLNDYFAKNVSDETDQMTTSPKLFKDSRPTGISGDRRASRRQAVDLCLDYQVMEYGIAVERGNGRILDMSQSGLSFESQCELMPGSLVRLTVHWPLAAEPHSSTELVIRGTVVRSQGKVTAVRILRRDFRIGSRLMDLAACMPVWHFENTSGHGLGAIQ